MDDRVQLNVDMPRQMKAELLAYCRATRQQVRHVIEDLVAGCLAANGPLPKKRGKVSIPSTKAKRTTSARALKPKHTIAEVQP